LSWMFAAFTLFIGAWYVLGRVAAIARPVLALVEWIVDRYQSKNYPHLASLLTADSYVCRFGARFLSAGARKWCRRKQTLARKGCITFPRSVTYRRNESRG
jgi:hypothetical protein